MYRLPIFICIIPIIVALGARWWFSMRILAKTAKRSCSCDLGRWESVLGADTLPLVKQADAVVFAEQFRKQALIDWRKRNPKQAASREATRHFGMAAPPFALVIGVLGLIAGRIPTIGVLAIFLAATALAVVFSFLSIASELNALLFASRQLRANSIFHRRDDEDAVIESATALVWKHAVPPILQLLKF